MGRRNRSKPITKRRVLFLSVGAVGVMTTLAFFLLCERYCWCGGASGIQVERSHITVKDGDKNPFEIKAFAVDENGRRLACKLSFLTEGSALESVGGSRFACIKTGQATVKVSLSKQHLGNVAIKCLFVDRIEVPSPPPLRVGDPPRRLEVKAYSGEESVPDAVIEMESSRPEIVRVEEGYLVPVAVGRAAITVRSGQARATVQVTAGEITLGEFIEIDDGGVAEWRLSPGHYFVEVEARPKRGGKSGLTLSWTGAFCPNQGEDQLHRLSCYVENEAVLRLHNPCFGCTVDFIPRVAVSGYLRVTRIP